VEQTAAIITLVVVVCALIIVLLIILSVSSHVLAVLSTVRSYFRHTRLSVGLALGIGAENGVISTLLSIRVDGK